MTPCLCIVPDQVWQRFVCSFGRNSAGIRGIRCGDLNGAELPESYLASVPHHGISPDSRVDFVCENSGVLILLIPKFRRSHSFCGLQYRRPLTRHITVRVCFAVHLPHVTLKHGCDAPTLLTGGEPHAELEGRIEFVSTCANPCQGAREPQLTSAIWVSRRFCTPSEMYSHKTNATHRE